MSVKKQHEQWAVNPIQLDQVCSIDEDGSPIEVVASVLFNGDPKDSIRRARLIGTAPRLLATLEQCVSAYETHRDRQPTGHLWPDPNHIAQARAVIAEAKGGA